MSAQNQNYNGSLYRITPKKGSIIEEIEEFSRTVGEARTRIEVITRWEMGSFILRLNDAELAELMEDKALFNLRAIEPFDNAISMTVGRTKGLISDDDAEMIVQRLLDALNEGDYNEEVEAQELFSRGSEYAIIGDIVVESATDRDDIDW